MHNYSSCILQNKIAIINVHVYHMYTTYLQNGRHKKLEEYLEIY